MRNHPARLPGFARYSLLPLLLLGFSSLPSMADRALADFLPLVPESEKIRPLFNGRTLEGWDGDPKYWRVEEGAIVGANTKKVPTSTYLFTGKSHREFRLVFEVKQTVSPDHSTMHSAVAALGERFEDKGNNKHGFKGPLLMFCHDWGIWDAYRRNRVEPAEQKGPIKDHAAEKKGDWNRIEILVLGNRIRMAANGILIFDFTDEPEMLRSCPIGLQLHSNGRPQEFRFRGLLLSEKPADRLLTVSQANKGD
jgi:hypothetical protein